MTMFAAAELDAPEPPRVEPAGESPSALPGADLTESMRQFAVAWLKTQDRTAAYLAAYPATKKKATAKTGGAQLSRDPRVLKYVEALRREVVELSAVSILQIETQAARIAFADLRMAFDARGQMREPKDWPSDLALALAGYEERDTQFGVAKKMKLPDKNQALRLLAELKGALDGGGEAARGAFAFHFHLAGAKGGKHSANAEHWAGAGRADAAGRTIEHGEPDAAGSTDAAPAAELVAAEAALGATDTPRDALHAGAAHAQAQPRSRAGGSHAHGGEGTRPPVSRFRFSQSLDPGAPR